MPRSRPDAQLAVPLGEGVGEDQRSCSGSQSGVSPRWSTRTAARLFSARKALAYSWSA
jgi:hypothetical protein